MPRTRPDKRLQEIVIAAADVFIESQGYRRTQMEDIAKRAGVSKGTLYLYVESKEVLFDLAVRYADNGRPPWDSEELPVKAPPSGSTAAYLHERVSSDQDFTAIARAVSGTEIGDARDTLERVVRGLYRVLAKNRRAIKLVDVCAADHPELAEFWYALGRGGVVSLLEPFLERGVAAGQFLPPPDVPLAARFILESCMLWGVHIHWDPHPEVLRTELVEDTVVLFVVRALAPIGASEERIDS